MTRPASATGIIARRLKAEGVTLPLTKASVLVRELRDAGFLAGSNRVDGTAPTPDELATGGIIDPEALAELSEGYRTAGNVLGRCMSSLIAGFRETIQEAREAERQAAHDAAVAAAEEAGR